MRGVNKNYWGTESEIDFIQKLGKNRIGGKHFVLRGPSDRKTLLKNYIKAASNRKNWGAIDRDRVLDAAENALNDM